jgi:hypothetical protein
MMLWISGTRVWIRAVVPSVCAAEVDAGSVSLDYQSPPGRRVTTRVRLRIMNRPAGDCTGERERATDRQGLIGQPLGLASA